MYIVGDPTKTGFVSGYMATVPAEWQPLLGGPAVTGQCCIPVVTRTSWGLSAFAWNPSTWATSRLYRPLRSCITPTRTRPWARGKGRTELTAARPKWAAWRSSGDSQCSLRRPKRNRPVPLRQWGPAASRSPARRRRRRNVLLPPDERRQGPHAYPYNYQLGVHLNDLADVKAGQKQPWDVSPTACGRCHSQRPNQRYESGGSRTTPPVSSSTSRRCSAITTDTCTVPSFTR